MSEAAQKGLISLGIRNVRNLEAVDVEPSPALNVVFGANASGKTSVLEAIYCLGRGRSFRTNRLDRVIRSGAESMSVFTRIARSQGSAIGLGMERSARRTRVRLGGEDVQRMADVIRALPVQLIHPGSHRLLEEGPRHRRRYLDWGVFHVEPEFYPAWRRYRRALQQRNAALREGPASAARAWDNELVQTAAVIDRARRDYVGVLEQALARFVPPLLPEQSVTMTYGPGWPEEDGYAATLERQWSRDQHQGFTGHGPHRAELRFLVDGTPAVERVSRGQQKVLAAALLLAQAACFVEQTGAHCLLLLDDVAAELDPEHRDRLLGLATGLPLQAVVTTIESDWIEPRLEAGDRLFHVEHGQVRQVV